MLSDLINRRIVSTGWNDPPINNQPKTNFSYAIKDYEELKAYKEKRDPNIVYNPKTLSLSTDNFASSYFGQDVCLYRQLPVSQSDRYAHLGEKSRFAIMQTIEYRAVDILSSVIFDLINAENTPVDSNFPQLIQCMVSGTISSNEKAFLNRIVSETKYLRYFFNILEHDSPISSKILKKLNINNGKNIEQVITLICMEIQKAIIESFIQYSDSTSKYGMYFKALDSYRFIFLKDLELSEDMEIIVFGNKYTLKGRVLFNDKNLDEVKDKSKIELARKIRENRGEEV